MLYKVIKEVLNCFLNILDSNIWIILNLISGELLMKLIKKNFKISFNLKINQKKINGLKKIIKKFCNKKKKLSSCLSKSITVKLVLDFLSIQNKIYFGISKFSNGEKIAHAWVVDPITGEFITPGIDKHRGLTIYTF